MQPPPALAHRTLDELTAALAHVRAAPRDAGPIELIVRRPGVDAREVVAEAALDPQHGLVGDSWSARPNGGTPDRRPDPERQLTLMPARAIAAIAGDRAHWPLAGDQLYVDLDLSAANLPPGTRLLAGTAVLEVAVTPHTGCAKFSARFGSAATRWVNTPEGRALHLRGINARVVTAGVVRAGDLVRKQA